MMNEIRKRKSLTQKLKVSTDEIDKLKDTLKVEITFYL